MATIITKNSGTASSVPTGAQLTAGELAVNTADKRLFTKNGGGTVVELGTNPSSLTLPNGTANGVPYLNASKVLTSGSALTFDGTDLASTGSVRLNNSQYYYGKNAAGSAVRLMGINSGNVNYIGAIDSGPTDIIFGAASTLTNQAWYVGGSEQMRLTSTGLGIGTSSLLGKLTINGSGNFPVVVDSSASYAEIQSYNAPLQINRQGNNVIIGANLGLGVTPSAWGSFTAIEGTSSGNFGIAAKIPYVISNAYFNGSAWAYKTTAAASTYYQNAGNHYWNIAPSGTAGAAITFTQAMTLDASGNLGVGTASPSTKLHVLNTTAVVTEVRAGNSVSYASLLVDSTGASQLFAPGGTQIFNVNGSERARIDSSGNLLVGTTSTVNGGSVFYVANGTILNTQCNVSTSVNHIVFRNSNGNVGSISTSGSATAYNTSSDYRLKENVQPMTGALAKIAALKPCTYTWKADGSVGEGFIAHELAEVCPQAVTGEKDAVDADGNPQYQGIDVSFLVGTLTAAIQELKASLDEVKLEFDAYKAAHP